MDAAVFLDRDGTLNLPALNPANGLWESPHRAAETAMVPDLAEALGRLSRAPYRLFVVSNQPSAAKGKCSLADLDAVHQVVERAVAGTGARVEAWYYCRHHPLGSVPELTKACGCRKPGSLFLRQAAESFKLDLGRSWFVGDSDVDVACGRAEGCRSVLIEDPRSSHRRGREVPDFRAGSLLEAVETVLREGERG